VWQLVDSAFPTGSFSHSLGLESAWQHGDLRSRDDLRQFVRASLLQSAHGVVPLVNAAYRAPGRLAEWDALNDAFLTNTVANRASRVQGRTLVATATRVWPTPALEALSASLSSFSAHVAPITGVVFRQMTVPLETTQLVVLFSTARGVLSAAVRLGLVGSYEAQQMQSDSAGWALELLRTAGSADDTALAQTAPIIDILQGAHDRLYSRLFQS
jgi:urease accessory protein